MTTTKYATWANVFHSLSPREDINNFAADFAADFDLDAIEDAYRDEIDQILPGTMQLVGEELIADVADEDIPEDWTGDLKEQAEMIDMGQIFEANTA